MSKHKLFEDIDIEKYKVLISSTSFTPDEDFNILLDALKNYENTPNATNTINCYWKGKR